MKKGILLLAVLLLVGCSKRRGPIGKSPNFTLVDLNNVEYTLSEQRGKVVVLDFWATWCRPCIAAIPIFNRLYTKYKEDGFLVLGIGLDGEKALRRFIKYYKVEYPILIGNEKVATEYGIYALPTTYIVDKQGNIVAHHVGITPDMELSLEEEIKSLLGK